MDKSYDVHLGDQIIGAAQVEKQGLYYHFSCSCRLSGEVIYKIIAVCNDKQVNLGVCVPEGNGFGLQTRIPVKYLGEGDVFFRAVPRHTELAEKFIPISPDEPFSYIDKLNKAYLSVRSGQVGVVVQDE